MTSDDRITLTFPRLEVQAALDMASRVTAGIDKLWASGRLRSLTRSPEGLGVVSAFTEAHLSAVRQLHEAAEQGHTHTHLAVSVESHLAGAMVAFVRRLYSMLRDPVLMAGVGAEPITDDDLRFVEPLIVHAEGILAATT